MQFNSCRAIVVAGLVPFSIVFAAGILIKKKVVLTYSEEGCGHIGGKVLGNKDILIQHEDGGFFLQRFWECEVEVKPKSPMPLPGLSQQLSMRWAWTLLEPLFKRQV